MQTYQINISNLPENVTHTRPHFQSDKTLEKWMTHGYNKPLLQLRHIQLRSTIFIYKLLKSDKKRKQLFEFGQITNSVMIRKCVNYEDINAGKL
jgi:hypothetical protein